jgi:hypothetical protein
MIEIIIASSPHRDELVAEMWCHGISWGELWYQDGELMLEVYASEPGEANQCKLKDVEEMIRKARQRISELYGKSEVENS